MQMKTHIHTSIGSTLWHSYHIDIAMIQLLLIRLIVCTHTHTHRFENLTTNKCTLFTFHSFMVCVQRSSRTWICHAYFFQIKCKQRLTTEKCKINMQIFMKAFSNGAIKAIFFSFRFTCQKNEEQCGMNTGGKTESSETEPEHLPFPLYLNFMWRWMCR